MKLKKIASLMLAGVMAVSMLAGCQNANVDPEQPTDPETPTATGYSVEMASNLSDAAKKDYIAFEDNADDLAALVDAHDIKNTSMDYASMWNDLTSFYNLNDAETVKYGLMYVSDGTVDENDTLEWIAGDVESLLENLPNVNTDTNVARYTYDYTVSVSVANKALDVIDWYNGSANFIAVTVTRVPTPA